MAQDVFSKMAEDPWLLNEDGYLNADTDIKEIIYHPSLNVILICTNSGVVRVLDVNSGVVLQSSYLSAVNQNEVTCKYIPGQDRILFCDGQAIGVRSDYNGVLLLDSILQKNVTDPKEDVKLELPLSEAVILKQGLVAASMSSVDHVANELNDVILNAQKQSKKGIKAQKWNTVCLQLPLEVLRTAVSNAVYELLIKNQHTPELGVTSAVQERLSELAGEQANASDRKSMASESKRRETFTHWPHMDYKWALPDQMAQAGFYHQPNSSGDDRAMCFTCTVCLVCWERTDEPWSEHERHSPNCPFVMGEYTQNVPLSVTYATNPALDATYRGVNVKVVGTSTVPHLLPTGNVEGLISVFDVSGKVKRTHSFFVSQFDSHILEKFTQDFGVPALWGDKDDRKYPVVKKITALSIVSEKIVKSGPCSPNVTVQNKQSNVRPTIVCGLNIRRSAKFKSDDEPFEEFSAQSILSCNNMMDVTSVNRPSKNTRLYLVVYDFTYSKEKDDVEDENKTLTGNSNATSEETWENEVAGGTQKVTFINDIPVFGLNDTDIPTSSDYNIMKHLSNYYSDEVFVLPPDPTVKQPHSGPRLLPLDLQNTETDSSPTNSFIIHAFMNGSVGGTTAAPAPNTGETQKLSISDHINELKNSKTTKKLNYSRTVQCVSVPQDICATEVSDIITTLDGNHILVVVKSAYMSKSVLLLYALDFAGKMVRLQEVPILTRELLPQEKPLEVTMLPPIDKFGGYMERSSVSGVEGNVVLVCADGAVRIVDLSTMRTVCFAKLDSEKFVSAAYCNSLERLCASTEKGSLHFYALNDADNESSEDHEEDDIFGLNTDGGSIAITQTQDLMDSGEGAKYFHDPPDVVMLADLKRFSLLCGFEPLKTGYCAVVPPCWSEIQQALRQRRHPQSLKIDSDQHTKTWRLQTDTTTWDEHIFEITLPSSILLGHVDVHFSLQPSTTLPHVEVTLLKQNTTGIGHKRDVKFAVDETVTIDMLQWADNPVISQEYLRAHNADILAGPINIASHLDLTEQGGVVTLTSPKLFKSKNRTLLLHIRAVYSKEEANGKNNAKGKRFETRSASIDKTTTGTRKTEFYMGCDCIHELSVTVYSSKHTDIPHERTQRNMMLESNTFVQSLAMTIENNPSNEVVGLVLDIMSWLASIRLARNRSNNGEPPNHQEEFVAVIENNLLRLVRQCLLLGGRSVAHKCMKVIMTCCSGAKNINESTGQHFYECVLKTLFAILESVNEVKSAAGLQWLLSLLLKVTTKDKEQLLAEKCVSLLSVVSDELNKRTNPYHLLLRSRYGLYGTPMEPELFDIEPPPYAKGTSTSAYLLTANATVVPTDGATPNTDIFTNYAFNKESISPKDVLSSSDTKLRCRKSPKMIRGLIETEPLHFTCVSASEGTRLERADVSNGVTISTMLPFPPPNPQGGGGGSLNMALNNNKKDDIQEQLDNFVEKQMYNHYVEFLSRHGGKDALYQNIAKTMENNTPKVIHHNEEIQSSHHSQQNTTASHLPWHQLLIAPPQQVIVVERMHSGARRNVTLDFGQPVLLTDILIPCCRDLVTLSVDIWLTGEDVDVTRLVVASDIGSRNLMLNDLQPPPLCRYLKISAVGRYGMSTTRCRIPAGYFYGHMVVLPEDVPQELAQETANLACTDLEKQLTVLSKLFEDISCRYSLACSKLKELLQPFLVADMKNAAHLSTYMNVMKDKALNVTNLEHSKIFNAYQEAITYQHQLNTVRNAMTRIEESLNESPQDSAQSQRDLPNTPTDKLRAIAEGLLDVLLSIDATTEIKLDTCRQLFHGLCVSQSSRLQLLVAIFLDKSCGKSSYWGNFLADTLQEMFSTSYTSKFPQDRLFILLAFLSRRSPERSSVIDAALRVVWQTLNALVENRKPLLAVSVDLPLLSWLLMYLSLQLDLCKVSSQSSVRWDWVLGEMIGKAAIENSKGNSRKKSCKRGGTTATSTASPCLFGYNPQQTNQPQPAQQNQPIFWMNLQGSAWKAQEFFLKKQEKHSLKFLKKATTELAKTKETNETPNVEKVFSKKLPAHIDTTHCLVVAKGLLHLILSMDHSSSADMMLLSFKVISKLVVMAKLRLGQLINEQQLLTLVNFCIASKIPWAPYALACFLQDVLELSSPQSKDVEMETESSASTSWAATDLISDVESLCETFAIEDGILSAPAVKQGKTNTNSNANSFPLLPSVYESDDSDLEELLEDFDKSRRSTTKKSSKQTSHSNTNVSAAIDSRLEMGVETAAEIALRKLLIKNTHTLFQNITFSGNMAESEVGLQPWPTVVIPYQNESSLSNHRMLTQCFESLFEGVQLQSSSNLEQILNLWLTLNCSSRDEKFNPSTMPQIPLRAESVKALITEIAWTTGLSLPMWTVVLQTLTLVCNINTGNNSHWSSTDLSGMASSIITHNDIVQFFMRLLSGTGLNVSGKVLSGPLLCKALHDLMVRLQIRCDIVSVVSKLGNLLKTLLLKIVYQLTQPSGPIASRQGPLDAQCKLLQCMLYLDFSNTDLSIAMSILESTGALVHSYVMNNDKVKCINIGEKQSVMSSTFNDIFASVLGSDSNKQDRPVSCEVLLITLLKLVGKLVQTPLPQSADQAEAMDTEPPAETSQTDERKAEQIQQQDASMRIAPQAPCFADVVLKHHPTVIRLCHSLAACKSSSLCMLANVSQKAAFSNLSEPNTVGDAVFHVLASLAKKASKKEFLMQPLLMFLSQTPQLSEPLLWFILQVLDTEEAIRCFLNAGGMNVLGLSFVRSCCSPSTISKMGTISIVMQHFSGANPTSDASTVIAAASATKKLLQATLENKMALVNFAPCSTIKCQSGTAQPADVLIQGLAGVTHRRARTPLWSYHFYPEEVHTELTLQLPSAILLKEVQLQPHAGSLATCPSAVALEISADGPSRLVPASPPIPTSGMTYIRLHLPVPKVVNCVLIRLYKPRDANSIGLLQIRLLGNSAFGGSLPQKATEAVDDDAHCKHSLGWLRLLHHCFTLPTDVNLTRQVVGCASQVENLLNASCGLLLVPSHVLPVYLPCLEKVLRELALYSPENGVHVIRLLLDSKSSIMEPHISADSTWQDRLLITTTGYQSACELFYQICEHQDENTVHRVKLILDWLQSVAEDAVSSGNTDECNPAYISSIASVLWSANQSNVNYDLKSMVPTTFFDAIYNLKINVENNLALKYSLDSLLCSLCYIRSDFFPSLLQRIGVLVPNLSTDHGASISDDRKDSESMTDDHKRVFEINSEWYGHLVIGELSDLNLTDEQLETVALVSRSPTAIQQLLDSGLPKLLNSAILEFCSSNDDNPMPMAKLENVTAILKFFTDVSDEKTMRDWLGSSDGSSFWLHLLHWLCKKPFMKKSNLQTEAHTHLEEVCVKFLSKCCLCHPTNQARLAKVLCEVIALQSSGISGFMRRLILQLLLENEKIPVSIVADETLYKSVKLTQAYVPTHPAFKQTYNQAMLYLSTNTTLVDILEQHVYFNTSYKMESTPNKKSSTMKKDIFKDLFTDESDLSMAAGVTAKDKRAKDAKNLGMASTPLSKKKRYAASETQPTNSDVIGGRLIKCESFSDQPVPLSLNLGQLLRLVESRGTTADWPCIHLRICQSKNSEEKTTRSEINAMTQQQQPFSSALQVFSSMGGLALLAQHLPTVYPEAVRPPPTEKTTSDQSDSEWIKVEDCDDIYEDIEETVGTASPSKSSGLVSHVPPHSLTAFGLFLRLPGYAEVLLKDMRKALCLLRLVLGVTDDGEGGDIFQSSVADSLPTLPFEVLRKLYDATPLSTDDGRLLRRISINTGVVHLLLACLGIFTHHSQGNSDKDGQKDNKTKEDRSQLYWAKGTGFGTGSTQQSWNVEQALLKQRSEEEHVTVLLQVLASYVNPGDEACDELSEEVLPSSFYDLLAGSSLLPALSSYLRNDSVLDMARHIPLYKAALQLLRAFAASSQLVNLLLPQKSRSSDPSVGSLLRNMKTCVDTYASKLRINSKGNAKHKTKLGEVLEDLEQGEGLATLMPDIQQTATIVSKVTSGMVDSDHENDGDNSIERRMFGSLEEQYLKMMKGMQFGSYEMITELPEGGLKFIVSHHFESNAKLTSEQSHPARVKRIAQEAVTLSTSLPLSYSSSVFVRYDTSRLDVMKVLITGPAETPYANGCFEFDVFFPPDYPLSPMMINLETTGRHSVRFNPNLYNDGKVCLSVLNTWHGRPEEKWNAQTSSFLQVLVSIQSLILVPEPYFNEPGYERARGTPAGTLSSKDYNLNICQATVRWAMLEQIVNPCPCFREVVHSHFYMKRQEVLQQVEEWIKEVEIEVVKEKKNTRSSKKSPTTTLDTFKKVYQQLKDQLSKLKPPEGVEEEDESPKTPTNNMEVTVMDASETTSVNGYEHPAMDNDIDMEKMVNDMLE